MTAWKEHEELLKEHEESLKEHEESIKEHEESLKAVKLFQEKCLRLEL